MDNIFLGSTGAYSIFFTTFFLVLLAEMGDKTQLLVMALTTCYKLKQVVIGVISSIIVLNILAVLMGSIITTIIPIEYIKILASISFIIFGLLAFRKEEEEEENVCKTEKSKFGQIITIAAGFFVAELGDKTQLATMALAAQYRAPIQVLLGSILAMIIADGLGLVGGLTINKYIPQSYIKIISGIMFIIFGLLGLKELIPPTQLSIIIEYAVIGIGIIALGILIFMMSISRKKRR